MAQNKIVSALAEARDAFNDNNHALDADRSAPVSIEEQVVLQKRTLKLASKVFEVIGEADPFQDTEPGDYAGALDSAISELNSLEPDYLERVVSSSDAELTLLLSELNGISKTVSDSANEVLRHAK